MPIRIYTRYFTLPNDPRYYMFDDLVEYYRLKYSIAKFINPKTILDTGVQYGYSAIAFLAACPKTEYIGISYKDGFTASNNENDADYARCILNKYNARIIIKDLGDGANPLNFAGHTDTRNRYDLVHVNFREDADFIYHNLELALRQSEFILVDGYYKSKDCMLASSFFLEKYKNLIGYAMIIPNMQSLLLIKVNDTAKKLTKNIYSYSYNELEYFYDKKYYLTDCGGYQSFKKNSTILDNRLYIVQCLANAKKNEQILDLGCGRGELAFAMAQSGADVLGIDYSATAIEIAEKNFRNSYANLHYKNIDFFKLDSSLTFDKIVASDLAEHIDTKLFGEFMENIINHLKPNGKFILHTAPNKYIYSYKYKKDRLKAKELGLYLPENPRSFYESLMHINEQTPGSLKKALKKHFKCFYVWTGNIGEPLGNLSVRPNKNDLINHHSIFAIASNGIVVKEDILNSLKQNEIKDISGISLELLEYPKKIKKNKINTFRLKVSNNSNDIILKSIGKNPINIAYHIKKQDGNYIIFDGIRTRLPSVVYPKNQINAECSVLAPYYSGTAVIEFTMVQEGCFWFENLIDGFSKNASVEII